MPLSFRCCSPARQKNHEVPLHPDLYLYDVISVVPVFTAKVIELKCVLDFQLPSVNNRYSFGSRLHDSDDDAESFCQRVNGRTPCIEGCYLLLGIDIP